MKNLKEKMYSAFNIEFDNKVLNDIDIQLKMLGSNENFSAQEQLAYESYREDWILRYVYNSNAIEGSSLSLQGTKLVIDGEFPPHNEQNNLKDVFAVAGVKEGYEYMLQNTSLDLSTDLIKDIHANTAYDMQPATRGMIRSWPVYIQGSNTVPVHPSKIRESLDDLIFFYQNSKQHPIVKGAALHAMFEMIHPFGDCNGRTGRALLNYSLLKDGYRDITIKYDHKADYCSALENWQLNNNPSQFIKLVAYSEAQEINNLLKMKKDCIPELSVSQSITHKKVKEACPTLPTNNTKSTIFHDKKEI